MPVFCEHLSAEHLQALNQEVNKLPAEHHLKKDSDAGSVSIAFDEKAGVTIFYGQSGFYFRRGDLISCIQADLNCGRGLICTTYTLTDDTKQPDALKAGFQECFGLKKARKIDTYLAHFNDRIFLLAKFPPDVMKQLFEAKGGVLKTGFCGPRESLLQIPTLTKYLEFKETDDHAPIESVFATDYKEGHYDYVHAVHYQIVQDVINHPNLGICLCPIAAWSS
jgi:hypothetical protein